MMYMLLFFVSLILVTQSIITKSVLKRTSILTPSSATAASTTRLFHGHGHGHGDTSSSSSEYSFVQTDMRAYAMKLHTRDQSPKEGQQKAETPFTQWIPSRANYLQFLVDSLHVYETLDSIVAENPTLSSFISTGLERSQSLKSDIQWMKQFDPTLQIPECGDSGKEYSAYLQKIAQESLPKFMCHYYNHYFAHTAGGRMIGKKMADNLLDGYVLDFYKWSAGDVRELLDNTRKNIDLMANTWSDEQKKDCLEETMASFRYGGGLMSYMRPPAHA